MLRTRTILPVVALLGCSAYGYMREASNSNTVLPLVRVDSGNIRFLLNTSVAPGFSNSNGHVAITASSDPLPALAAAEEAWGSVGAARVHFQAPAITTLQNDPSDGQSVITIADTPENRSIVGDFLAITAYTYDADGALTDTDIILNPAVRDNNGGIVPFSTDQEWNSYDLRSALTHELGHALGAGHSGIVGSTMNFATSPIGSFADIADATVQSTLSTDDVAFLTRAYPAAASARQFGAIKGTVAFSNGNPVLGAWVVAMEISTGVTIGGLTSLNDGTYLISPVPPGAYFVYAQPVKSSSLVSAAFRTTLAGGNESPWSVAVSDSDTSIANITADPASSGLQITWLGVGSPGGSDWSYATVKTARSGGTVDVLLWGPNLNTSVIENQIRIFGPDVDLVPGSFRTQPSAGVNGMIPVRFTINIFPSIQRRLISVGILNGTDASIVSGGLVALPTITINQGTLPANR
jgi:hypothetical protein